MAGNPIRGRQATAPDYGAAMDTITRLCPAEAAAVRHYVTWLNGECAKYRTEAKALRAQRDDTFNAAVNALLVRDPAPSTRELGALIAAHGKGGTL